MIRADVLLLAAMMAVVLAVPAQAGSLRIGMATAAITYANPYSRDEGGGLRGAIFDALTTVDSDGQLFPALAESWRVLTPTSWAFDLRPGVVFSNGEPFNAASVVTNLNLLIAPGAQGALPRAVELSTIERVEAAGDTTVIIHTKEPDPLLARRLSMIAMVPPKAWAETDVAAFARAPIGTGPYVLQDWVEDNKRVRLTVNPTSWRTVKDVTDVELIVVADAAARLKALISRSVDVANSLGPDDIEMLEAEGFHVRVRSGTSVLSIAYRNVRDDDAPLKDVRVRQALNYAVNKERIVDAILAGTTRIASQGVAHGMPGHNPDIAPYPYDPAKARAMLAEAGYPDGFPLTIAVYGGLLSNDTLVFQQMAQDLGEIGVKVELRPMVFSDYARRLFNGDWDDIDAFSNGWLGLGYGDPIRAVDQFSCRYPAAFFCAPEVLPYVDATRTEMDPLKREQLMQRVMVELNNVGVALWLIEFSTITGLAPHIGEFDTHAYGIRYEDITLKK